MQSCFDCEPQFTIVRLFGCGDRSFDRIERRPRKRAVDNPMRRNQVLEEA
jgi:hypothetical protein